jgi:hypothetical protein
MQNLNLQLYIIPGHLKDPQYGGVYKTTFDCWKNVWDSVYSKEMKIKKQMYSDDFLRQDHIVALFSDQKCAGLAMVRFTNFYLLPVQEDSYFRFWPKETLKLVSELSHRVAIASYFTVHPDFRQQNTGICMKTLLLSLFLENFKNSHSEIMITAARKKTSNEKLCSKLGSKILANDIPYLLEGESLSEMTDLIYWEKNSPALPTPELEFLKQSLWKNRVSLIQTSEMEEVNYAA